MVMEDVTILRRSIYLSTLTYTWTVARAGPGKLSIVLHMHLRGLHEQTMANTACT